MLDKHNRLWADLAFRSDVASWGNLEDDWKALIIKHPDRMMLGTDTYTPERLAFIPEHAASARSWLVNLPDEVAAKVAWKNAYDLIIPVWHANREQPFNDSARSDQLQTGVVCEEKNSDFVLQDEALRISIEPIEKIAVSEPFSINVMVCGKDAQHAQVTVDATMPSHGHGMNYAPPHKVLAQDDKGQQLHVEGMVLHMPGSWQWQVEVNAGDERKVLTQNFLVQ